MLFLVSSRQIELFAYLVEKAFVKRNGKLVSNLNEEVCKEEKEMKKNCEVIICPSGPQAVEIVSSSNFCHSFISSLSNGSISIQRN